MPSKEQNELVLSLSEFKDGEMEVSFLKINNRLHFPSPHFNSGPGHSSVLQSFGMLPVSLEALEHSTSVSP